MLSCPLSLRLLYLPTQTLVCSLVLSRLDYCTSQPKPLYALLSSRLDYCNSLLSGCPQYLLDKLHKFRMQLEGLCVELRNLTTSILFFKLVHWLPVTHRIQYKISYAGHLFGTICLKHSATLIVPPLLKPPSRCIDLFNNYL